MSISSVCQGLQSCLEPRVMESRVLRLKLSLQQGSNFPQPSPTANNNTVSLSSLSDSDENEGNGWSFLQSLSHTSHCNDKTEDQVYVHPAVKRSSSILSEKSLEMCTECLGSETGINASESSDEMSLFSFDTTTSSILLKHNTTPTNCESKRVNRACNFPPPLTTITDFGGVHVRPRREDGRLILEAVASPSPRPYFHAERGDGRLRLCLFESFSASDGEDEVCDVEEQEEQIESEEEEECGEGEDEMGVTKLARPSRCKESGKRDIFGDGLANLSFPCFLSVSE